jgi:hypothetical protein
MPISFSAWNKSCSVVETLVFGGAEERLKSLGSTGIQGVDREPHALARGHLLTRVVLTP